MPYAINGAVSQDQLEGGLEITDAQYIEAIEGMMEGKVVSIVNGFSVIDPTPTVNQTNQNIIDVPENLFGGPNLKEIFNGN